MPAARHASHDFLSCDRLAFALLLLGLLAGCAGPRASRVTVRDLDEVNARMQDKTLTLHFTNGQRVQGALDVRVSPELVTYRLPIGGRNVRPVKDVARIVEVTGSHPLLGLAGGMVPGLFVAALSAHASQGCDGDTCGWLSGMGLLGGAGLTLTGGAIGLVVGGTSGRRLMIYEGPVERYLEPRE